MQKIKFNIKFRNYFNFFIIIYFDFNWFYFNEDSLGGANNDFNYHYKISLEFSKNFFATFDNFGTQEASLGTRITIFWMLISQMNKLVSYDVLRIVNSFASLLICLFFLNV